MSAGFTDPWDVVVDSNLTSGEKREILSDWATDARAVEGRPDLRMSANGAVASWADLIEGLRLVDAEITALSDRKMAAARPGRLRPNVRLRNFRTA